MVLFGYSTNLLKCGRCLQMFYCSKECQVNDWKNGHKFSECDLFGKLSKSGQLDKLRANRNLNFDKLVLLLRFVLKSKLDKTSIDKQFKLYNGANRTLRDLVDHSRDQSKLESNYKTMIETGLELLHLVGCDVNQSDLNKLYGQLTVNYVAIRSAMLPEPFGSGLYLESTIFDHSCAPSACRIFDGLTIQIRALKKIDTTLDGQPTITYIDPLKNRLDRQSELRQLWYFDCSCERCSKASDIHYNYDRYRHLMDTVGQADDQLERWMIILKLQRQLVGQYSPICTSSLSNAFFTAAQLVPESVADRPIWVKQVKALEWQLMSALAVTHGRRHSFYKQVVDLKTSLYQELTTRFQVKFD